MKKQMKKSKDTWKDAVLFFAEILIFVAMFVYFVPVTSAESAYVFTENGETRELVSLGTYTITAYCPCKKCNGKWAGGITASGVYAKANHTIAAPKNFKFGTKLVINGITYTVEDRGGAIKGKKLDIYFSNHSEALKFGKRKCEVFIYE